MNTTSKIFSVIIVILVVVSAVLGMKAYQKPVDLSQASSTGTTTMSVLVKKGSTVELVAPSLKWTQTEFRAWAQSVESNAVSSNLLNVTGCRPNPIIISVALGSNLTLQNDDTAAHTITLSRKSYTIQGKSVTTMKIDFSNGVGGYVYKCDEAGLQGVISVHQANNPI